MPNFPTVKAVEAVAILASAFTSGGILSISFTALPTLTLPARASTSPQPGTSSSHLTHQWLYLYDTGKKLWPSIGFFSVLCYSYVAYAVRGINGGLSRRYLTAATLVASIVPFTFGIMLPTNKRLQAHATRDDGTKQDELKRETMALRERQDREVPELLTRWTRLNAVRGLFPLLGAAVGAATSFGLV